MCLADEIFRKKVLSPILSEYCFNETVKFAVEEKNNEGRNDYERIEKSSFDVVGFLYAYGKCLCGRGKPIEMVNRQKNVRFNDF